VQLSNCVIGCCSPTAWLYVRNAHCQGWSVMAFVHGFAPYLYCPAPYQFKESDCELFRSVFNEEVKRHAATHQGYYKDAVLMIDIEYKQSIMGYQGDTKIPFLRITMASPKLVPVARRVLEEEGVCVAGVACCNYRHASDLTFDIC
jgi:DNA polymerase delta subunit 1